MPVVAPGRRLAWFVGLAVLVHGAALWLLATSPQDRSRRVPTLHLTLERREVVVPERSEDPDPEMAQASPSREAEDAIPDEREPPVGRAPPGGEDIEDPRPVDPYQLLRRARQRETEKGFRFPVEPEASPLFDPEAFFRSTAEPDVLPPDIWRGTGVAVHDRFTASDGRQMWIRRYGNGDIRVCERPRDDLLDHWDNGLPFACER